MLRYENVEIAGLEPAIRGMRNPMNSWDKSDSEWDIFCSMIDNLPCNELIKDKPTYV